MCRSTITQRPGTQAYDNAKLLTVSSNAVSVYMLSGGGVPGNLWSYCVAGVQPLSGGGYALSVAAVPGNNITPLSEQLCVYLNPPAANTSSSVMLAWISKVGEPCSAEASVASGKLIRSRAVALSEAAAHSKAEAAAAITQPAAPTIRQQAVEQVLRRQRDWRARAGRPVYRGPATSLASRAAAEGLPAVGDGSADGVPFSSWTNASSGTNGPLATGCPQSPIPAAMWGAAAVQVR